MFLSNHTCKNSQQVTTPQYTSAHLYSTVNRGVTMFLIFKCNWQQKRYIYYIVLRFQIWCLNIIVVNLFKDFCFTLAIMVVNTKCKYASGATENARSRHVSIELSASYSRHILSWLCIMDSFLYLLYQAVLEKFVSIFLLLGLHLVRIDCQKL